MTERKPPACHVGDTPGEGAPGSRASRRRYARRRSTGPPPRRVGDTPDVEAPASRRDASAICPEAELSLAALDLARASSAASFFGSASVAPLDFPQSSASASAARFTD